jgi:hypothetical protein
LTDAERPIIERDGESKKGKARAGTE